MCYIMPLKRSVTLMQTFLCYGGEFLCMINSGTKISLKYLYHKYIHTSIWDLFRCPNINIFYAFLNGSLYHLLCHYSIKLYQMAISYDKFSYTLKSARPHKYKEYRHLEPSKWIHTENSINSCL